MKALTCPLNFPHYKSMDFFRSSGGSFSEANSLICLEIELIRGFMPVVVTCNFRKDPIKNEDAIMSTTFFPALKGA